MLRGFLLGSVSGVAVAAVVVAGVSLLAPQPAGNRPPERPATDLADTAPGLPPGAGDSLPDDSSSSSDAGLTPPAPTTPPGPDMPSVASGQPPLADTAPAQVPELTDTAEAPSAPETRLPAPVPPPGAERPVTTAGQTPAPQIPAAETVVDLSTAPAERPAPLAPALETPALEASDADASAPGIASAPAPVPDLPATPDLPEAAPPAPELLAADIAGAPRPEIGEDQMPAPVPDVGTAESPAISPSDETIRPVAPDVPPGLSSPAIGDAMPAAPGDLPESGAPSGPGVATADIPDVTTDNPPDEPPAADLPVPDPVPEQGDPADPEPDLTSVTPPDAGPTLPGGDSGIRVNRPGNETSLADPDADPGIGAAETDPADDTRPPLLRYATPFDNPEGLPRVAVIVIDDGSMAPGPAILGSVPFPLTVAIDPARDGAAEAMAAYRAAGIEVAVLAQLPEGAGATDLNVNLQAAFATLPETIALVDPGNGGIAEDRDLTSATLRRLATDGRGFVWPGGGLDQTGRLAEEADVPAVSLFRDLDGADQDAATIRRFIDNAAFRARQDGNVVLLARLRPETVSALTLWGTANRAGQVAMAPLSAILSDP